MRSGFSHAIMIERPRARRGVRWVLGHFGRGVGQQKERGFCGYPVNRWSTKRTPNGMKLDRQSTGAIPRPLGNTRSIPRTFNTRSQRETKGERRRA